MNIMDNISKGAQVLIMTLFFSGSGELRLVAQEQKVSVKGEVPAQVVLSMEDLGKLSRSEIRTKDKEGKETVYTGTPLVEILRAAGMKFEEGAMPSREAVASYVLVEAADGYKAVFAFSEIDPAQSDRIILLADHKDGQPLDAKEGPCRIVVPDEKRASRWVRQVTTVSVHQAGSPFPN